MVINGKAQRRAMRFMSVVLFGVGVLYLVHVEPMRWGLQLLGVAAGTWMYGSFAYRMMRKHSQRLGFMTFIRDAIVSVLFVLAVAAPAVYTGWEVVHVWIGGM